LPSEVKVIISEVADKGTSNACGGKADWVELHNTGSSGVSLADFKLHDDNGADSSTAFVFASDAKLEANAFLVLCAGVDGDDKSPKFKIGGGDTITLVNAAGKVVSTSGELQAKGGVNITWAFNSKTSSYEYTSSPTPGGANVFTAVTNKWSRERVRLVKQHEDGEAFFESTGVAAAKRLPPVVELRLTMSAAAWAYQQANASYELYKPFTGLEVTSENGAKSHAKLSVGGRARPRGQSTNTVTVCMGSKTFPWIIDVAGGADSRQRLFGMEKFYLRNHYGDASYMREWTMHRMLRRFELPYLRTRTVKLFVNGEYTGLYSLIEAPDQDYVFYRSFGVDKTNTASTKPPFAEGHALYKAKTHAIGCNEDAYAQDKARRGISDADIEARKAVAPKNFFFYRGEHRPKTPVLKDGHKCQMFFYAQMDREFTDAMAAYENSGKNCGKFFLDYGRVELDFGGSDPKTDNNDGRMIDLFNTYFSGKAFMGCGAACDNSTGIYASFRNTPKVDVDQWLRNFAVYAVTEGHDSPMGIYNNFYLATPGGSSETDRAYRLVQWDHNNAMNPNADICELGGVTGCGNRERYLYRSMARPTCQALSMNPFVGPLLSGEGNKANMQKYLAYVKEFNEKVFTNEDFIAIVEAHAQAISAAVSQDPGRLLTHGTDFSTELSASAGKWENSNLLAFMKKKGEEVKKQIVALEAGTFPRMDHEVPKTESCQDWRRETPSSDTYVEDGAICNQHTRGCQVAYNCFLEEGPGWCDATTGQFTDTTNCGAIPSLFCRGCFPHSKCGSKGDALRPPRSKSTTYVEDGKACTAANRICMSVSSCYDESIGLCDAKTRGFTNPLCNLASAYGCAPCFPYSRCGTLDDTTTGSPTVTTPKKAPAWIGKAKAKAKSQRSWVEVGSKLECDGSAGEVYMQSSRGKVPTLDACKQSCKDAKGCNSITYYKSKWCTHWGTLCTKTKWKKKAVMSLRMKAEPRTWIEVGSKLVCDGSAGEVYLQSSRGKVPSLEVCMHSCEDAEGCKSISYFNSKWCTHWGTLCTKTKWNKKVAMSLSMKVTPRSWIEVGSKLVCDGSAGEVHLDSSRGKLRTLEACKQSCEDAKGCESISYFKSGWCSHWSTSCTKTKWKKKVVMSLRWSLDAEIAESKTASSSLRRGI